MTDLVDVVENHDVIDAGDAHEAIAPKRTRFRRRRPSLLRSLAARLVLGVTALVVVVIAATGWATYHYLHNYLYRRLDQQVSTQADATLQSFNSPFRYGQCSAAAPTCLIPSPRGMFGAPSARQTDYIVLLSPAGDIRSSVSSDSVGLKALNLSLAQRQAALQAQQAPYTVHTTSGATLRITVRKANGFVIVSGLSSGEETDTLHTLLLLELVIGAIGLLVAFVVTAAGMYAGLGPLKRVTRTARQVTAELSPTGAGLDRRVPETGSTTEVGQLATSFNTMLDQVQTEFTARCESEERMRQFLADASHELRTPLTSIRGYAELARLQRGRQGAPDPEDDSIGRIETEGTRMSRLVEDLLLLARGDDATAVAKRVPVDVGEQITLAVHDVRMAHPQRDISSSLAPGLLVSGDPDQLLRVLRNLIGNAAVHTDPGSPIRVTGRREQGAVILQVADGGPGLPPDEAAHVFERFWRADKARTRVRGGSGLGMSIVAQIVGAHGGDVVFDSSVTDGTTVTVVLPTSPLGGNRRLPSPLRPGGATA